MNPDSPSPSNPDSPIATKSAVPVSLKPGSPSKAKMGVAGHCFLVFFGILAIFFRNPGSAFVACAGAAVLLAFVSPRSLLRLFTLPPLIMVAVLFATVPWLIGSSREAFVATGVIAAKALTLLAVCDAFSSAVSVRDLTNLFSFLGFSQFGFVFGIAFNSLPVVKRAFDNAWISLKLKGGIRGNPGRAFHYLALNLIVNLLKYSEDIASAAKIKRFDPLVKRRPTLAVGPVDAFVSIYLVLLFMAAAE